MVSINSKPGVAKFFGMQFKKFFLKNNALYHHNRQNRLKKTNTNWFISTNPLKIEAKYFG